MKKPLKKKEGKKRNPYGCKCHYCGERYKVDVIVPDEIWRKIYKSRTHYRPPSAGLLCGPCILKSIEKLKRYSAFELVEIVASTRK